MIVHNNFGFNTVSSTKKTLIHYYDNPIQIEFPGEKDFNLASGKAFFTEMGIELSTICESKPDPEFRKYLTEQWKRLGYIKD